MVGIVLAPSPQQPVSLMLNEKVKRRESEFERTPNNSRLLFPNHRSTNQRTILQSTRTGTKCDSVLPENWNSVSSSSPEAVFLLLTVKWLALFRSCGLQ